MLLKEVSECKEYEGETVFLCDIIRGVRIEKEFSCMEAKKYQAFWRGAIILTIASFVTKVLSAFYRIPYQNIAGDVGFYIYQQIYPFYGFCLILATYGFPIIISKMVAERLERGKQKEAEEIICVSFSFF